MQKQKEGESVKKVVLGGAYIIGGILLTTLSMLKIDGNISGLILSFPVIGLILFLLGSFLGIRGLYEDKDENE